MPLINYYWKIRDYLDSSKKGISYIASSDGSIYEAWESQIGKMIAKSPSIPTLDDIQEGFQFRLPKIPGEMFSQIYSFFKAYCDRLDTEVMLQIFFDTESGNYFLECPVQYVSKVKVDAVLSQDLLGRNSLRYIQVAQIHSHNSMSAYFSSTDDADEKAFMIYGVFGLLNTERPQCKFRVKANNTAITIPLDTIFQDITLRIVPFPLEWEKRIIFN
ncbi:hypothetical protein [Bacillus sp. UMB0728]|uniref:hypothetical protein n=1 Tax=Bacillus sp. UMB0728 TaxID=2066052 RepID=UPI000C770718|nr:hypothetical protein [Bacillus sp. UMB0728]PLR70476.1 hypothetical protein CYJ37_23370 [Bacillus sp. UMB0728]